MSKLYAPAPAPTRHLRRTVSRLSAIVLAVDALVVVLVTLGAAVGRTKLPFLQSVGDIPETVVASAPFIVAGWLGMLFLFGGYDRSYFGAGTDEYRRVLTASLAAAAALGIGCYLTQFELSRAFYFLLFAGGTPLLLLSRLATRRVIQRRRAKGGLSRRVLIAGDPRHVEAVAGVLQRESWLGYRIVGCLTAEDALEPETRTGIPILGRTRDAASIAALTEVDTLLIAEGAFEPGHTLRRLTWELESQADLEIAVAPSLTDVAEGRVEIRSIAGLPLVYVGHTRAQDSGRWAKRVFDIVGSAALLLVTAPLFAWAALRIRLDDGGPVLFRQTRVGLDGQTFECLKLRTMVTNAEELLKSLAADDDSHVLFKMKTDPRITKVGRFLRRFSIDELPQLVNVLRGDMSLVGPRPPLPSEVERYERDAGRRLHVRPGMTGLWQISGRSNLSWDDTVRLDTYYVDNWSMSQDLMILAKTVSAVAGARGAY